MEVKINREIREYDESVFFGMSLRQCGFAAVACAAAVTLYFALDPYLGIEELSWVCILGAAPFAAAGFVKWHGMTAEQAAWTWAKSELLTPKRLVSRPENLYGDAHEQEARRASSPLSPLAALLPSTKADEHAGEAASAPEEPARMGLRARLRNIYVDMLANLYAKASGKRDAHDQDAL